YQLGICLLGRDDLDQLQLRNRVEKVDTDQTRRILQRGGDVGELEARGVGGEDRAGLRRRLELREERALRFQVLEDRLDDHVGARRARAADIGNQPVERVAHAARVAQ